MYGTKEHELKNNIRIRELTRVHEKTRFEETKERTLASRNPLLITHKKNLQYMKPSMLLKKNLHHFFWITLQWPLPHSHTQDN